jgi:predicted RNA-binding Zn ribbon-like protein
VATARYRLRPAPGGLALVQDLLNTRAGEEYGPDLLGDSANAQAWAVNAVRAWSAERERSCEPPTLTNHDAHRLRDLRGALERSLAGVPLGRLDSFSSTARFTLTDVADVSWTPRGQGWRWLCGAVLGEILLSRQAGTWQRLKQCRNSGCRAAFYDSSWNVSGVWHDPGACSR